MKPSIIDIAKKVVEQTCKGANLMFDKAFYVSIEDNSVTVSNDINTIDGGVECILYLPSISHNTVNDRNGSGTITFGNKCYRLIYIDKDGGIHNEFEKDGLSIWCNNLSSSIYGANARLCLSLRHNPLYNTRFDKEEDILGLWESFLLVRKVIGIKEEEFNKERKELISKIDELSKGEKRNNVMDSNRGIINE